MSEEMDMRAGITITRNIAATRDAVTAAVDRHVAHASGSEDTAGTWHRAEWTSSLRSWRRVGCWRRTRHDVAVTVDLLEIGTGFTQLNLWADRPRRLRRRVVHAELVALVTRIRDSAESGGASGRCLESADRPPREVPATAVPAVGYSLP